MSEKKKDFEDVLPTTDNVKIGDKNYVVGENTIGEQIAFSKWCKEENKKEIKELAKELGQQISLRDFKDMVSDPNYQLEKAASLEGVIFLAKKMLKRLNENFDEKTFDNDITYDKLKEIDKLILGDEEEKEELKNLPTEEVSQAPEENVWLSTP